MSEPVKTSLDPPDAIPPKPSVEESASKLPGWCRDFLASIVVFLVALPLCVGIAVAVGVSPGRAILSGVIGGIVVGFFAGSPLQVSGPAAGLFVLIADLLVTEREKYLALHKLAGDVTEEAHAALESQAVEYSLAALGIAVLIGGFIQYFAGRFGMGQWFRAVSPAVIRGMLAGIGILIISSQLHMMLDHDAIYDGHKAHGGVEHLLVLPDAFLKCVDFTGEPASHRQALLLGLMTIITIIAWQVFLPKSWQLVPPTLVAVLLAVVAAQLLNFNTRLLEAPSNLFSDMTFLGRHSFAALFDPGVVMAGMIIAVVASAETLLCAAAIDQMHTGPRTDYDQELASQGIGNIICGLIGAIPITGVIVRSSANVQAGADSRLSSILHGVWLLVFVVALPFALNYIPKAALGGVLVYTGFKLIDFKAIWELARIGWGELAVFLVTCGLIVVEDLLVGVVAGTLLASARLLYTFSRLDADLLHEVGTNRYVLRLDGVATFLRLPLLAKQLERIPRGADLHVELARLVYIDHACMELLIQAAQQHESTGGQFVVDWEVLQARFHGEEIKKEPVRPSADESRLAESQVFAGKP